MPALNAEGLWARARAECDATVRRGGAYVLVLRMGDLLADTCVLSGAELKRAASYRRQQDVRSFVLGRTAIDRLLRPRGAREPTRIELGEFGKPRVSGAAEFNLSHAWPYCAIAVCAVGKLGVDVELLENCLSPRHLFGEVLHPAELKYLQAVDPGQEGWEFRRCWTRKEALLKGQGSGLSRALNCIDTRLDCAQPVIGLPESFRVWDVHAGHDCGVSMATHQDVKAVTTAYVEIVSEDRSAAPGSPLDSSWCSSVATILSK